MIEIEINKINVFVPKKDKLKQIGVKISQKHIEKMKKIQAITKNKITYRSMLEAIIDETFKMYFEEDQEIEVLDEWLNE